MGAIYGGFPRSCCRAFRCHRLPRGRATVSLSDRPRFAGCRFLAGMPASSAPIGKSATPRDAAEPFGATNGGYPGASRTDPSARRRRPRRSTDESSLTRGSARGSALVTKFARGRDVRGVPAGLLPGLSLPRSSTWPSHRFPFRQAPFRRLTLPCRYVRPFRSDWQDGNAERRRRTIRSYERRFPSGFQD
jgi:hypothetical protein